MNELLDLKLQEFFKKHRFSGKGPLSVALHVTRYGLETGLPIDAQSLKTDKRGQVKGLGKSRIQAILVNYDILTTLAEEGGRTSRGSLDNMELYVRFLNDLDESEKQQLHAIEQWWVQRVQDFFTAKPFRFDYDTSLSVSAAIKILLQQAEARQQGRLGATYLGAMLQHLVGAKLELSLMRYNIILEHHGASVADTPTRRDGDFVIDKTAIHVTAHPGLSLIQKCQANLARGYQPIIITLTEKVTTARVFAEAAGIGKRIDILPAEEFLAANLHELSGFSAQRRAVTIEQLISRYNAIVEACETDRSLRIVLG
jgi:hypothetical protein